MTQLEQLYNKVFDDLKEYENSFLNDPPQTIIDNAYDIFHAQNFAYHLEDFIANYEEDDDYHAIGEDTINKIIACKHNIVEYWLANKHEIRHAERYNLEIFDDFVSVLEHVIALMGE